ncbi:molybdopterin-dependent oxidoreductase [Paenibacillus sp. TRM 82003]|nr:molybdopterin-dependent oxidoreductase [Paenibacillus sp. TRM 82003]
MRAWMADYTVRRGKRLKALHVWNAWIVLALAVSGTVLYLPALRGATAPIRTALKQGHIVAGLVSIVLLLLYVPFVTKHAKQLRGKPGQTSNLVIVLFLLVGWSVSGVVLWLERSVPPIWTSAALMAHDLLTWVGVPYALFHSITRSRWMRERRKRAVAEEDPAEAAFRRASEASRRTFVKSAFGAALALAFGVAGYRWLKRATDGGGVTTDAIPSQAGGSSPGRELLSPHPDSSPPIGGGGEGSFRIYTVTPIPKFDPARWEFTVNGLVDRPLRYDWESFVELARSVQVSDFHCVTGWSVYHVTWEGISLKTFLELAGVQTKAKYVKFYSGDGVYTDALTLEQAKLDDVMVAALIDGKPIPDDLGGPVRLVVPKMYAYKSVKWLQGVELIEEEHIGYWEVRGYDVDAWVPGAKKTEEA